MAAMIARHDLQDRVRLRLAETPAFQRAVENNERVRLPMLTVCRDYTGTLVLGTFAATATFVVFYIMTVFALSWGTSALHFERQQFLIMQMIGCLFFGLLIPVAGKLADRIGGKAMLIVATTSLPTWARAGFSDPTSAMPNVLGRAQQLLQ